MSVSFPAYCVIGQDVFVTPTQCGLLSPQLPPSSNWSPPCPRATSISLPTGSPPRLSYGCCHWLVLKKESQSYDWNSTYLLPRPNAPTDFQVFKKGRAPLPRDGRRWAAKPASQLSSLDTSPITVPFCWSEFTYVSLIIFVFLSLHVILGFELSVCCGCIRLKCTRFLKKQKGKKPKKIWFYQ